MAVDSRGEPAVDPTANVLLLVNAAVDRLDDIRALESRRIDDLREADSRRIGEQMALRAEYAERLAIAEAKRIDAIRAVDVSAVAVASQRASDQAAVLATQVAQSAEALRGLVSSTAATVAASQQQLATTLSTRITTLEQAQYEGKGKQAVADPMMLELVQEMKALRLSGARGAGVNQGGQAVKESGRQNLGLILSIIGSAILVGGVFAAILGRLGP